MIREADELYRKLHAAPQGDDKPWIQLWLAFGAKKNSTQGRISTGSIYQIGTWKSKKLLILV